MLSQVDIALFHIVPDSGIAYDIIVGHDLIDQGFSVELSNGMFSIKRKQIVNLCEVGKTVNKFDNIDTDLCGK